MLTSKTPTTGLWPPCREVSRFLYCLRDSLQRCGEPCSVSYLYVVLLLRALKSAFKIQNERAFPPKLSESVRRPRCRRDRERGSLLTAGRIKEIRNLVSRAESGLQKTDASNGLSVSLPVFVRNRVFRWFVCECFVSSFCFLCFCFSV